MRCRPWLPIALAARAALAAACATGQPTPFSRTPDERIGTAARAIIEPQPTRPEGMGAGQIATQVTLRVEVDRTGAVRGVTVVQSAGEPYNQDAIDAMRRARFQPALDKAGQPVDCEILWRLDYSGR